MFSLRGIRWSIAFLFSVMTFSRSGIFTIQRRSVCIEYYSHPRNRALPMILQVLSGGEFKERMMELVEPLAAVSRSDEEVIRNQRWVGLQKRIVVT